MTRQSLFLAGVSILAAVISYLFNPILTAPYLQPEGIAVLGTFLSFHFVLTFFQRPVEIALIRAVSSGSGNPRKILFVFRKVVPQLLALAFGGGALLLLASPWVKSYFHLRTLDPFVLAVALSILGFLLTVARTPLLGFSLYGAYGLALLIDPAARLIAGLACTRWNWGADAMLSSYMAGYAAACVVSVIALGAVLKKIQGKEEAHTEFWGSSGPFFVYSLLISWALSVDALMVKHYFTEREAGFYMAAATIAKMVFVIVTPVAQVSFAEFCRAAAAGKSLRPLLAKGVAIILAAIGGMAAVSFLFSKVIIRVTYGEAFMESAGLLIYVFFAIAPVALLFIQGYYYFARGRHLFLYGMAAGALIQLAGAALFHQTMIQAALVFGAGGFLQCLLGWGMERMEKDKKPSPGILP